MTNSNSRSTPSLWRVVRSALIWGVGAALASLYIQFVPESATWSEKLSFDTGSNVTLSRQGPKGSIMHIRAEDMQAMWRGFGYAHAKDRLVSMYTMKIAGQGRISELLADNEKSNQIDMFLRSLRFYENAQELWDAELVNDRALDVLVWYSEGVNKFIAEMKIRPLEFYVVGFDPSKHPWTPVDTLAGIGLMCYVSLADRNYDAEKSILQALKGGVHLDHLASVFSPLLDPLKQDTELLQILKNANFSHRPIPEDVKFLGQQIRNGGSNNWVVAPKKTASGTAILACDPHMGVGRLPSFWYEIGGKVGDLGFFGVSLPGIPGLIYGRTNFTSFGITNGFVDQVDLFVEKIQGGKYLSGDGSYQPLKQYVEVIKRKGGKEPLYVVFFWTRNGILDIDPVYVSKSERFEDHSDKLQDGFYLATCLSVDAEGAAMSLRSFSSGPFTARTVSELSISLRQIGLSGNYLLADSQGNIGLQQTGKVPLRPDGLSGFIPVRGWIDGNLWKGILPGENLVSELNPERGYISTANNNISKYVEHADELGRLACNAHMGNSRVTRINELLEGESNLDIEDMIRIQQDTLSVLGRKFMHAFRPLLLNHKHSSEVVAAVLDWDLRMETTSREATFTMDLIDNLVEATFGVSVFGEEAWRIVREDSSFGGEFYWRFTDALFFCDACNEFLYSGSSRSEVFSSVLNDLLAKHPRLEDVQPWGEKNEFWMENNFFQGALPRFLGFDSGPYQMHGGRETVVQGLVIKKRGKTVGVCGQVWRFITDMGTLTSFTTLPGGPSARRLSGMYTTGIDDWLNFRFKNYTLH